MSDPYTVVGRRSPYNYYDLELQTKSAKDTAKIPVNATTIVPAKIEGAREIPSSWRIVRFFVFIWTLIKQIFCPTPPKILSELDNALYAHLLLEGGNRALPNVQTSALFAHIHDFLAAEKEVPAALLAQIKQTGNWLAVIEQINKLARDQANPPAAPEADKKSAKEPTEKEKEAAEVALKEARGKMEDQKQKLMAQLVTSIIDCVKSLREGESCVMPGGTSCHFALYRVTLTSKGYEFQIISRDPALMHGEVISVAGKEKIRIGTTFAGLKLEEITDPVWMQTLFDMQLQGHSNDLGALARLMEGFRDRKIDPASAQNLGLHKSRRAGSAIGTLMNFLQDASGLQSGSHRRKLRMQVNALFRYAESVARMPTVSGMVQEQLQESIKRLNQKMLGMVKKGELTQDEHDWLSKEFSGIEKMLKASVEEPTTAGRVQFPEIMPVKALEKPRPPSPFDRPASPKVAKNVQEQATRKEAAAYQPQPLTFNRSTNMPLLDRDHVIGSLETVIKEIPTNTDSLALVQKLTDICLALPFETGIQTDTTRRDRKWVANPNDMWPTFSPQERIHLSEMLGVIAKTIGDKLKETNTSLPDRWLALFKVANITVHLAILNTQITKVTAHHTFPFNGVLKSFFQGEGGRTMYRRRYNEENLVAKQLFDFDKLPAGTEQPNRAADETGLFFADLERGSFKSDSEQVKHLVAILDILSSITHPTDKRFFGSMGSSKGITSQKINLWGRPVQHQSLAAGVYAVAVAEGTESDPRNGYMSHGNPWFVQEAIVDDPIRILQQALVEWNKDHPERLTNYDKAAPKHKPITDLEVWEIREILLTTERNTVIWNLLGLIEQHPSILLHPDICSMVEILFLDFEMIVERSFESDPGLKKFLGPFFDKHINAYCRRNQIGPALFLIHLSHALRTNLDVAGMEEYSNHVYKWLLEAFQPGSQTERYRYALLSEYMTLFEKRTTVRHEELRDLIVFNFYLENTIGDPAYFDPVQKDRIRRMMQLWVPAMRQGLSDPQFMQHTLDRICQLNGKPLPKAAWAGTFPEYTAGTWLINIMKGTIQQIEEGSDLVSLPPEILRDENVLKIFPDILNPQPKVAKQVTKEGMIYAFKDKRGCEVRIEQAKLSIFCYRKHPERDTWLQPITLQPDVMSQLPKCMASQQFFIAVDCLDKPDQELWALAPDGTPQFRFHYTKYCTSKDPYLIEISKEIIFKSVDDMRPGGAERRQMVSAKLSLEQQPDFTQLLSFDSADNIILWSKDGQLKQVEFLRRGLRFNYEKNCLKCAEGPFKDYVVNLHPSYAQTEGLVAGLLLEHPEKPSQLLLPTFGGTFSQQQPPPPVPPQANLLTIIQILGSNEPILVKFPHHAWMHDSKSPAGFWVLENKGCWKCAAGQNEGQLWFDVLRYSMASAQLASCDPLPLAKRALHEMSRLAPGAIADTDLLKMEGELSEMALRPRGIKHCPYGDGVALALQGLLLFLKKGSNRVKQHLENKIADLAVAYFSSGKHIDTQVSLNDDQVTACLHILRKHKPDYFSQNAALLLALEQPQSVEVTSKLSKFFMADTRNPSDVLKSRDLVLGLVENPGKKRDLYLCKDRSAILDAFAELYKLAQAGPKAGAEFSKMRCTLKALPTVSDRTDTIILTDFLSLLYDLRAECPDFALPDIPTPEAEPKRTSDDWIPSKADIAAKQKWREDTILRFGNFLDTVVRTAEKMLPLFRSKVEAAFVKKEHEVKSKDASHLIADRVHELAEVEDLEKMLAARPTTKAPTAIYALQPNDRLFTDKEIAQYFVDAPQSHVDNALELERIAKHAEPVVGVFKEQLQKEMTAYKAAKAAKAISSRKVKDASALESMRKMLTDKSESCVKEMTSKKEAVMAMLKTSNAAMASSEQRAGYRKEVTWEQLTNAFFDDSLPQLLRQAGFPEVSAVALKASLGDFLKLETHRKYALFCRGKIEEMIKDKTAESTFSGEQMVEMLTRCRAYDPIKHPQILVVEDELGFMMTAEQLEAVSSFVQNPNGITRALTGMGKTSVILLLSGLLKADGTNLVTLKFLDSLYPENVAHIQKVLGGVLKKRVTPLQFSMKTPLVFRHYKGDKLVEESEFKRMYRNAMTTILEKGCMLTDRRSQPLLEAKWISLLYRISSMPAGSKPDPMEKEHIFWLSKLLTLLHQRQHCVYDEHDKSLYPKEEIHLRIGQSEGIPEFSWLTTLEIFDVLRDHPKLGLLQNIQGELSQPQLEGILQEAAKVLATKWNTKHSQISVARLELYFKGESEDVLKEVEAVCTPAEQDQIALTKDMLLIYLLLTLSKTGNKKYIMSADGRSVIPCDYADVPREGAEFEEIRERIPYFIQNYYQNGVSLSYFQSWVQRLTRDAFEQMENMGLDSVANTPANQLFQSYFPTESLGSLLQHDVARLHAQVKKSPNLIRKFLVVLLPELRVSLRKIAIDAHNQVSMSHSSAGTSATMGCVDGLHRQFRVEDDSSKHLRAKMLTRFLSRMHEPALLTYDPAKPKKVIKKLVEADKTVRVVIDGAGALWSVQPQRSAQQLKEASGLESVGYFAKGRLLTEGNAKAGLDQRGQVFSHAQARGANVKLSGALPAVLTANGRTPLEEVIQNEGRLRQPDQPMRVAVPKDAGIKSVGELINRSLVAEAVDYSDNVFRSKKQEQRDIVRSTMIRQLTALFSRNEFDAGMTLFQKFIPSGFLIHEGAENWMQPGQYYRQHHKLEPKNANPIKVLEARQQQLAKVASGLGLDSAAKELLQIKYNDPVLASKMPLGVFEREGLVIDREIEVETEQEVEAETELSTEVETEMDTVANTQEDMPYYIGWRSPGDNRYREHSYKRVLNPAYDEELLFSENFLPLFRNTWAARVHRRTPHDLKQNRLHYVHMEVVKGAKDGWALKVVAGDLHDQVKELYPMFGHVTFEKELYDVIYDTKLRREFAVNPRANNITVLRPDLEAKKCRLLVQMRFEDGQYENYTDDEMEVMGKWINEQKKPEELEDYFVKEVLKFRPRDREKYPFSQLGKKFAAIIAARGTASGRK